MGTLLKQFMAGVGGGRSLRAMIKSTSAFYMGSLDFVNNRILDDSGNDNHLLLKNASARMGNGLDLDYLIIGLLTTDTITVEDGSDTPTIPANGTLRIGAAQTVYGVTIRRGGVIWAVLPFCEPKINENMPTISYDVSGNGHHATCETLTEGNITTQDNYFYLQRYGYSLRAENVLGWNTASWSGSIDTYSALFAGVTLGDTQDATKNLRPTADGQGCIFYNAAVNFRLRRYTSMVIGKRYRLTMRTAGLVSNLSSNVGLMNSNGGIMPTNNNHITGTGEYDDHGVATSTTFELKPSNTAATMTIEFYAPKLHLLVVVPGLLSGAADAVGNEIEFKQDGNTLLQYGGSIQAPETASLISADQFGCWSDEMLTGLCVAGRTYKIIKTTSDHFGVGLEADDEFVAVGTESLSNENVVRELILNGANRGFFFTDAGTANILSYSDLSDIKYRHSYCLKPQKYISKYYTVDGRYPQNINVAANGYKKYVDAGTIRELVILKADSSVTPSFNALLNRHYSCRQYMSHSMVSFVWDHLTSTDVSRMRSILEARHMYMTCAINYALAMTEEKANELKANGHDIQMHTAFSWETGTNLPEVKGWNDTLTYYTESELNAYYAAAKEYYAQHGFVIEHKIYPGGGYDNLTGAVVPQHFRAGYMASASAPMNITPFEPAYIGRDGMTLETTGGLDAEKALVDSAIATKSWVVFYCHPSTEWSEASWANFELLLDYIAAKTAAGQPIRVYPIKKAFEIIQDRSIK